ncbi:MAG TPA: hypothetical protein PKB14_23655 [Rubrivivax sp.]|nr:hypothetical protein [Rubrivivax sp.]
MRKDQLRKQGQRRNLARGMGMLKLFDRQVAAKLRSAEARENASRRKQIAEPAVPAGHHPGSREPACACVADRCAGMARPARGPGHGATASNTWCNIVRIWMARRRSDRQKTRLS